MIAAIFNQNLPSLIRWEFEAIWVGDGELYDASVVAEGSRSKLLV
jgi:hypothetical protein